MNEEIIRRWNERVKPEDTVFFLGDFCFKSGSDRGEGEPVKAQEYIKQLNGNIIFIKGNHDCFSKDTKILTIDGYKSYNEISAGEFIPTVNLEKKIIEYNPILGIKKYNVDTTYSFKTKTCEGIFSNNHKHIVTSYDKRYRRCKWKKISSEDLWQRKSRFYLPTTFKSGNKDYNISDEWLKLAGWIFADGGVGRKYKYITIYQSKKEHIKKIKNICNNLKIPYNLVIRHRKILKIQNKVLKKILPQGEFKFNSVESKKIMEKLKLDDNKFPLFIRFLSDKQIQIFLESVIDGDGSKTKGGSFQIWGTKHSLEILMGHLVTHNIDCNLIKDNRSSYYLCVHIRNKEHFSVRAILANKLSIDKYNDFVWGVEVKNHIIFIETNGKPLITGNSNNSLNSKIKSVVIEMAGLEIFCVHNPDESNNAFKLNLCGHVHDKWKSREDKKFGMKTILINVGVDVWNFYPVSVQEILDEFSKYTVQ